MRKYTQLSEKEREILYIMLKNRKSRKEITEAMRRDKSTIAREIKRNSSEEIGYLPDRAHDFAQERKAHRNRKISACDPLKDYVYAGLNKGWSPAIISGRMKQQNSSFYACPEAIYQFVYSKEGQELFHLLPQQKPKRSCLYGRTPRQSTIFERTSIHERPADVNERIAPGHFEGDLVFHAGSAAENISVLIERKTRYVFLTKNQSKSSLQLVMNMYHKLKHLPSGWVKSITFDNGKEFSYHYLLKRGLNVATYFCDAFSAWQKGQVERLNRTIRRLLDKNRPLSEVSDEELLDLQNRLNLMPRRVLGFRTPLEAFNHECCTSL